MDCRQWTDAVLLKSFDAVVGEQTPPKLAAALRHAVFGGGSRLRPTLSRLIFDANEGTDGAALEAAAAAVEYVHCASLVHDDLPCFDDAPVRRGRPSVHVAFTEELAVLVGDALIVGAFDCIARTTGPLCAALCRELARGIGSCQGIVAGQAWESELEPDPVAYRRAKTGALFEAAAGVGALCSGRDPVPWRALGTRIGEAYQLADDLADALGDEAGEGKTVGRDAALGRPSAVLELGAQGAIEALQVAARRMFGAVPECAGRGDILAWLNGLTERLAAHSVPHGVAQSVGWVRA